MFFLILFRHFIFQRDTFTAIAHIRVEVNRYEKDELL